MFKMTNDVCTLFFFFVHESCISNMFSSVSTLAPPYLNFNLQPRVVSEIIYIYFITILYIFNEFIIFDLHVDTCILVYLKNT